MAKRFDLTRLPIASVAMCVVVLAHLFALGTALSYTTSGAAGVWGNASAWTPTSLPCIDSDVVLGTAAQVVVSGRARARILSFGARASIAIAPGATLQFPGPQEPKPTWCSAVAPYPVVAPVVNVPSSAGLVHTIYATLNVNISAEALRSTFAALFRDDNGEPLVFSLAWYGANSTAVDATSAAWLSYNDSTGSVTGAPSAGNLARTQSVYQVGATNSNGTVWARPTTFSLVLVIGKRPPNCTGTSGEQVVPWQLSYNKQVATEQQSIYNLRGVCTDPDAFPLTYVAAGFPQSGGSGFFFNSSLLEPVGVPPAVALGLTNVTLIASNNVTQTATFLFQVDVTTDVCPNANFQPPYCTDCKSAYFGSDCGYRTGTCTQHGTLTSSVLVTSNCTCSDGYSGVDCAVSPASLAAGTSSCISEKGIWCSYIRNSV